MSDANPPDSAPLQGAAPKVALVIAVLDEAENIAAVGAEIRAAFAAAPPQCHPWEVVFVDDGSTDATAAEIAKLQTGEPAFRLVRHDRRCGKTAALRTGIAAARAPWIATMDGDGQNDPADLVRMLVLGLEAPDFVKGGPAPLVAGIRVRRDDPLSRLIATRIANRFRRAVLKDACPDTGCGMKAFRREDFLLLPGFEGMHRFFPALFQIYGHPLICAPVGHRARRAGVSKYTNLGRALVGIADLLGVIWLRARTRRPGSVREEMPRK